MNGIIYKAVNKANGKIYIGKTTYELESRMKGHINNSKNHPFHYALKKYGRDGFDVSVIDQADNEAALSAKEMEWIKKCNCRGPKGYNMTDGGEGSRGYIASPEARAKISKSRKGRKFGPRSDEFKKLMSEKLKGRIIHPPTEQSRQKQREAMYRRGPMPQETRLKISLAQKGRVISDYVKECISKANTGRVKSAETRKKLSDSHRGVPLSAEHGRRIGDANRGRKHSKATILKLSEARKRWWISQSEKKTATA
jgi:group I intron endonuclease